MAKFDIKKVIKSGIDEAMNTPIVNGKSVLEWAEIGMKVPQWISVNDSLPDKSCEVITLSPRGTVGVHAYSEKWKAFNAHDFMSKETVEKNNINNFVAYWLPLTVLPDRPKTKEEGEQQ